MSTSGTTRAPLLFCCVLAMTACGGKESGSQSAEPPKAPETAAVTACDLVTAEEGAAVLGEAVNAPVEQVISPGSAETAAMSMCTVQATATPGKTLSISFRRSPVNDERPDAVRQTLTDAGVTAEDVAGVGDAAFWGASELHVFFGGNSYLAVNVRGLDDDPEALARAKEVAGRALDRAR